MRSVPAGMNENDNSSDPSAGIITLLLERMIDNVLDEGYVGTRITYMKLVGPTFNVFSL